MAPSDAPLHPLWGGPGEAHLFLPPSDKLLHLRFRRPGTFTVRPSAAAALKPIAWSRLSLEMGFLGHRIEAEYGAEIVYAVKPQVSREAADVLRFTIGAGDRRRHGLHLAASEVVDHDHPAIRAAAEEIAASVPYSVRDNAFASVAAILGWMRDRIRYTMLPENAIQRIAFVLENMAASERNDPASVLRRVLDVSDDFLARLTRHARLDPTLAPEPAARDLVSQLDRELMQVLWLGAPGEGDEMTASRTLLARSGKCVGIANLFVALARALGVPALPVSGFYLGPGGHGAGHAWALVHCGAAGWRECDPTFSEFDDFEPSTHAYRFTGDATNTLPDAQYLTKRTAPSDLSTCRDLIATGLTWLQRLSRTHRARAATEVSRLLSARA